MAAKEAKETVLTGTLQPPAGQTVDFADYRVRVIGAMNLPAPPGDDGGTDGRTQDVTREAPHEFVGYADPTGAFSLTIPATAVTTKPWTLQVLDRVGRTVRRSRFKSLAELVTSVASVPVELLPTGTVPTVGSDDPGEPSARLVGRVFRLDGGQVPAGLAVVIQGQPSGAAAPVSLIATSTGADGYFSGPYPRQEFTSASVEVPAVAVSSPVTLLATGRFPRRLVVGIPTVPPSTGLDTPSGTPRAPDQEHLTSSPEVFSSDLGGQCVELTVPNRTLEEFDFFSLVRTTDPEIHGLTLDSGLDPLNPPRPPRPPLLPPPRIFGTREERILPALRTALASAGIGMADDTDGTSSGDSEDTSLVGHVRDLREYLDATAFHRFAVRHADGPASAVGRSRMDAEHAADWDESPTVYQATTVAHGHLLHFKQVWKADGYSLGDLLYSLPLAPCQSKQVVTIDWERRETAQRTETTTEAERLAATLSRDRDINEVASSALSESMRAGSSAHSGSVAGGIGVAAIIGPVGGLLGVAGGSSSASSEAWQNSSRRLAAQTLQHLSDQTNQAASAVRSRRSTVVAEASQGETVGVTSEVITNHNHAHAMTVEYFEVLRHFAVSNELVGVRECLFVPLLMGPFTIAKTLRWKEFLAQGVPNELLRGFRALERIDDEYVHSDLPAASYADEAVIHLDGDLRLNVLIARPPDPDGDTALEDLEAADVPDDWQLFANVLGVSKVEVYRMHRRTAEYFDRTLAPALAADVLERISIRAHLDGSLSPVPLQLDVTVATPYRSQPYSGVRGVQITMRLNPTAGSPVNLVRRRITHLELLPPQLPLGGRTGLPAGSRAVVTAATVRYRTSHYAGTMTGSRGMLDDLMDDTVMLATALSPAELRNPRMEDAENATRLLRHLNDHIETYHRQIWLNMDTERRYLLLDGFLGPGSDRSLASLVDNQLIGIVGNSLVFPVAPGFLLDPLLIESLSADRNGAPVPLEERDSAVELLRLYQPVTPEPPRRHSLPTKGVFAEAVLGSCNSAEIIDETRFWRWSEEPCTDQPTPILPVSTDTRRAEPLPAQPSEFSSPIVAMQNAPAAPDPFGIAALLNTIGRPDLFRDLTGLNQNQLNALAGLQAAFTTAGQFGQGAAGLATTGAQLQARERMFGSIRNALEDGLIDSDQASKLFEQVLTGSPTPTSDKNKEAKQQLDTTRQKLEAFRDAESAGQIPASANEQLSIRSLEQLVDDMGMPLNPIGLENIAQAAGDANVNIRQRKPSGELLEAFSFPEGSGSASSILQPAAFNPGLMPLGGATSFHALQEDFRRRSAALRIAIADEARGEERFWENSGAQLVESDPSQSVIDRLEDYARAARIADPATAAADFAADNDPWSAAFVSYVLQRGGVALREFHFNRGHDEYIKVARNNREGGDLFARYWLCTLDEVVPEPGDILCSNRAGGNVTFTPGIPGGGLPKDFQSHTDVVTGISVNSAGDPVLVTIGGNIRHSVRRRLVPVDADFKVTATSQQGVEPANFRPGNYFAVIRMRSELLEAYT